jgi:hypothetical protein
MQVVFSLVCLAALAFVYTHEDSYTGPAVCLDDVHTQTSTRHSLLFRLDMANAGVCLLSHCLLRTASSVARCAGMCCRMQTVGWD